MGVRKGHRVTVQVWSWVKQKRKGPHRLKKVWQGQSQWSKCIHCLLGHPCHTQLQTQPGEPEHRLGSALPEGGVQGASSLLSWHFIPSSVHLLEIFPSTGISLTNLSLSSESYSKGLFLQAAFSDPAYSQSTKFYSEQCLSAPPTPSPCQARDSATAHGYS